MGRGQSDKQAAGRADEDCLSTTWQITLNGVPLQEVATLANRARRQALEALRRSEAASLSDTNLINSTFEYYIRIACEARAAAECAAATL